MNKQTILLILITLLSWLPQPANATPLVGDLSNYRINIDSGFNGTRIFLFGSRNDNGDIVVVVRGAPKNYIVRKKEQIAGIWVNKQRMQFFNMPNFYAVASSRPLADIEKSNIFRKLGIGFDNLLTPPIHPKWEAKFNIFSDAFLKHQTKEKLYVSDTNNINFVAETLFKTTIEFPDNIPPGDYTAEIYLLNDGDVVGMQSTPIKVVKSGLDAFLHSFAHEQPALYGIIAILMALSIGWVASRIFERI